MRVLVIDHGGFACDFVLRAQDDGHKVKWYISQTPRTEYIGQGLAEIVKDWREWMLWADLIVLGDNTRYLKEIDEWRAREPDLRIVGATAEAAEWELNRTLGQDILRDHGVDVPPYKEFSDYDAAIAYVKKEGRRFVSKPCGDEPDKSLSYCAKSAADMIYMLQRWKKSQRHKGSFILQEFMPGVEMAVGGWIGPHGFNKGWCENFEFKKLMAGDTGPATGEMGTVLRYVNTSKLAKKVLAPLEESIMALGYCGYIDVNCIIDEAGNPWPLEFTMRFGWPTFNIQQALLKGDTVQWLADLCDGRDAQPFSSQTVATGVVLAIPDFPYSKFTRKDVVGVPLYGLKPALMGNLHPCEIMLGTAPHEINGKILETPCWVTAGDYVLVATGIGDSVSAAAKAAYRVLDQVEVPNSPFWRPDIGQRLKKQLPLIQAKGYAANLTF